MFVVQFFQRCPCRLFYLPEVDQDSVLFEARSPQNNFHFPIMSVKTLTLAAKVRETVRRSKAADYFYFKNPLAQNCFSTLRADRGAARLPTRKAKYHEYLKNLCLHRIWKHLPEGSLFVNRNQGNSSRRMRTAAFQFAIDSTKIFPYKFKVLWAV